jgi:aspartate-semialdehyde dehydrogenase
MRFDSARPLRLAIAGATSFRGKELKSLLEESRLAAAQVLLYDEDVAAGTLTVAGGEPVVIQTVDEGSFDRVNVAFFAGLPAFTERHWQQARRAGAAVIDLSDALVDSPEALPWIPSLDPLLPPPRSSDAGAAGRVYCSPPAAAIIACSLAGALAPLAPRRTALVLLEPVSERGQDGIEELEAQTVSLLSFQPISRQVYDAQVAFNVLASYGGASRQSLEGVRRRVAAAASRYLEGRIPAPAIQILQAPVFYSYVFCALAEFPAPRDTSAVESALAAGGLVIAAPGEAAPDNVTVAGDPRIHLSHVERDACVAEACWIQGAADNVRLSAQNALGIAERLLAS